MYTRILEEKIISKMESGKAIILIGPRQVGKTTLIKKVLEGKDHLFMDGDDPTVRNILSEANTDQIRSVLGKHKLVFIDSD